MIIIDGGGWACIDCTVLIANGDAPADLDETALAEYLDRVAHRTEGIHVALGAAEHHEDCQRPDDTCDCEYDSFSWSPCDVCGSNLGGDRHAVAFFSAG